jgi:hypothetical protein
MENGNGLAFGWGRFCVAATRVQRVSIQVKFSLIEDLQGLKPTVLFGSIGTHSAALRAGSEVVP